MAGGFSVDASSLRTLAGTLQQVSQNLGGFQQLENGAQDAVASDGSEIEPFDTSEFDNAGQDLNSFIANWSNGVAQIQGNISTVGSALNNAADAYTGTESKLVKKLTPGSSSSGKS